MGAIIGVGDCHFPDHSVDALTGAYSLIDRLSATNQGVELVCQVGDVYEMTAFSTHTKSINKRTAREEMEDGRKAFEAFWRTIRKVTSSKTKFVQILGNHDTRFKRTVMQKAPELEGFASMDHLFKMSGVETILNSRQEYLYKDILFMHGYRSKLGDLCKYMKFNVVAGHSHRGGVHFEKVFDPFVKNNAREKLVWELNCGYLGAPELMGEYRPQVFGKWTWGLGVIDDMGPRFCPL